MALRVVASSEPDYGPALAAVDAGEMTFVGERYTESGEKLLAFEPTVRPNERGSVRIGRDFFTTALRDYYDWAEKWWREAIQNAVDAGATQIVCRVEEQSDGTMLISIEDNGGGMTEEVLLDKFLVLGGTTKATTAGSTGGFGKAKELLILPWLEWEIHTQDKIVRGAGIEYEVTSADFFAGTRLTVKMPADQTTTAVACLSFIGKCDLPTVRFTVNGEAVRANLRVGEQVRVFGPEDRPLALLHHGKKNVFQSLLLVRVNGLFMFSSWVSSTVKGQLIVEVKRPSIEVLTANRDGFRDWELSNGVQGFVNELSADTTSALRKKKNLLREKFRGAGKFTAKEKEREQRQIETALLDAVRDYEPRTQKLAPKDIARVEEILAKLAPEEPPPAEEELSEVERAAAPMIRERLIEKIEERRAEAGATVTFRSSPDLAHAMLDDTVILGPSHMEAVMRQLSWEPDFFIINEVEGFKVPKKFFPESMAPNIRKLARYWAELCRFVLIQLGSTEAFGVGFIIEDGVGAQYVAEEDEHWLMLNPFVRDRSKMLSSSRWPQDAAILSVADDEDLRWLYAAAVHECTHMADGISKHDEVFAAAMTVNVAKTAGKDRQLRAIRKAVVARRG